jgi:hypothetical protein
VYDRKNFQNPLYHFMKFRKEIPVSSILQSLQRESKNSKVITDGKIEAVKCNVLTSTKGHN